MGHQLLKEAPANEDQRKASLVGLIAVPQWTFSMFRRVSMCFDVEKVHALTIFDQ